jgi:hypothetical protein
LNIKAADTEASMKTSDPYPEKADKLIAFFFGLYVLKGVLLLAVLVVIGWLAGGR